MLRLLLFPFSLLFLFVVKVRNWLYDHHLLPVYRLPDAFIVSVGNLALGGAGKTPLVIELLDHLKGQPVALITRGYKGNYKKEELPLIVEENFSPVKVGDEPLVIKRRVPETLVIVDPDRVRGAQLAIKKGKTLIFLDDGMQHRRLGRDLEIVVVNGEDPFGGWLREPPSHLKRADFVVVMGGDYRPLDIPFIRMRRRLVEGLSIKGKKVALFCGVGNPEQVFKMLQEEGGEVVQKMFLKDHASPSKEKLHDFAALCENSGAEVLVCTEKDYVKLSPSLFLTLPVIVLKIRLEVLDGMDVWREILSRCQQGNKK